MRRLLTAALPLTLGAALVASPAAHAEPLLIVPGIEYELGQRLPAIPLVNRYYTRPADIGGGFYPDATPVVVDYPASLFDRGAIADHVAAGVAVLDAAIKSTATPAIVAGHSQGAVVVSREQARLEDDPGAPAADQLTFLVFGDPMRGLARTLFGEGAHIPLVGLKAQAPVVSRYDTVVVTNEYDFWADFPDRPWNPVALANAVMGGAFAHSRLSTPPPPGDGAPERVSVAVNARGATVTTYRLAAEGLPLTEPLRIAGVPDAVVDAVDGALRPMVDSGYSRNDAPGTRRPYLCGGVLRAGAAEAGRPARGQRGSGGAAASARPGGGASADGPGRRARRG